MLACILSNAALQLRVSFLGLFAQKTDLLMELGELGHILLSDLAPHFCQLQMMVHICEGKLEHFENELVPLGHEALLLLLQGA